MVSPVLTPDQERTLTYIESTDSRAKVVGVVGDKIKVRRGDNSVRYVKTDGTIIEMIALKINTGFK
jgi:hypothetical protein